ETIAGVVNADGQIHATRVAVGIDVLNRRPAAPASAKTKPWKSTDGRCRRVVVDVLAIDVLDDAGDLTGDGMLQGNNPRLHVCLGLGDVGIDRFQQPADS